jgi:RNA polymerase sigma-70 factor (ECF subfamily)
MIPDKEEARDIAMEGFSKAFGNLHRFRKEYSFNTWLYRVTINHSLDHLRKKRLPTTPLSALLPEDTHDCFQWGNGQDGQSHNPEEQFIQRQKTMAVERHLYALPPVLREIARMRFAEAYTYEEIARSLHVPLGTVKARVHRARYLLQESLQPLRKHL